MIVLDSSAAVEYLTSRSHGEWVEREIASDPDVHVPHLFDVEVANVFRDLVWRGELAEIDAEAALLDALAHFDVTRYPHAPLLPRMWELRENLSAYDGAYVALGQILGAAIVTVDFRLARAPVDAVFVTP